MARRAPGASTRPVEERLTEQIGRLVTFPEDTRDMAAISGALPLAEDIGRKLAEGGSPT